jgi:integrase
VRRHLGLWTALDKAFRLGKINVNPIARVELPKIEKHEAGCMTLDQMTSLKEVCLGDWTHCFIEVALATGCRRSELLALTWPDIDWMTSTVVISKSLEYTKQLGLRVKRPKNNKLRKFTIGASAIAALKFLREEQESHKRILGTDYRDHDLVFCHVDGSYFLPHLVSATISRRLKKAGIENASLHTTRHSHASHLLSNGVPLAAVSARLGHANVNITAQIYAHAIPDDDRRAAAAWESVTAREKTSVTSRDIATTSKEPETTVTQ